MAGVPNRLRNASADREIAELPADHDGRSAVDLADYRLLVSSLFSSPGSIIPGGIAGILTPFLCWISTRAELFMALTICVALVVVLRIVTVVCYRRLDHSDDTLGQTRRWDREYFFGATVFSAVLGFSCYAALAWTDDPAAHITSVSSTIALASGYVARNAGRPKFVAVQLLTFCVPMAVGLIQAHNPYYQYIGYFAFLYVGANIAITNSLHRNLLALSDAMKQSKALATALRSQNLTLDAALNTMIHGLAMFDRKLDLAVSNAPHANLYGIPETLALPGTPISAIARFLVERQVMTPEQVRDIKAALDGVQATQQAAVYELQSRNGRMLVVTIAPAAEGGVLMLTEDATERKATEARIEQMARFDELTGLANRFEFNSQLAEAFGRHERTGETFALLYIDLDGFKQVNDNLGHDIGDRVLIQTAARLKSAIRHNDLLARFGGDEFVLILPATDVATVQMIAQRMIEAMDRAFELDTKTVYVTASIGIALAPVDGATPADLLRHADTALYKAKAAGRNTATFFDPAMAEEMLERHEIEVDLRQASAEGALELYYQPIIDLRTQEVVTREALMRWRHPTRGMVPPGVFIPIAEQSGLIAGMGDWAIRQACRDAAKWPDGNRRLRQHLAAAVPRTAPHNRDGQDRAPAGASGAWTPDAGSDGIAADRGQQDDARGHQRVARDRGQVRARRFRDGLFLARLSLDLPVLAGEDRPELQPRREQRRSLQGRDRGGLPACPAPIDERGRRGHRDGGAAHGRAIARRPAGAGLPVRPAAAGVGIRQGRRTAQDRLRAGFAVILPEFTASTLRSQRRT
jgi:diguanylate cyclase (GGDEF)-like protein